MGKKKSKKKKNKKQESNNNTFKGIEVLGIDARQVGATLAGIVIGEVVEAATQRLLKKANHAASDKPSNRSDQNGESADREHSHPIRSAVAQVEDQLGDAGPKINEATHAVRASVNDLSPNLAELIEVLRDAGQRLKEKSVSTLNDSSGTWVEGVKDSAKDAIEGVTSTMKLDRGSRSQKQGKKKKK